MRIVAMSDTHGLHDGLKVPEGDVLIHAGDFMNSGNYPAEIRSFGSWFNHLPHKHKLFIAGNHDCLLDPAKFPYAKEGALSTINAVYLQDSGIEIDGYHFWGSPWTPNFFPDRWAFNADERLLAASARSIPSGTNVLVTHGPPESILDEVYDSKSKHKVKHVGSRPLYNELERIQPAVHIFGHIHGAYGMRETGVMSTTYYNVSVLDEQYKLVNPCTVIDL